MEFFYNFCYTFCQLAALGLTVLWLVAQAKEDKARKETDDAKNDDGQGAGSEADKKESPEGGWLILPSALTARILVMVMAGLTGLFAAGNGEWFFAFVWFGVILIHVLCIYSRSKITK